MSKLVVYVDMDSTLNKLTEYMVNKIPSDIRKHGICSTRLEHHFSCSVEDAGAYLDNEFSNPAMWRNIPPQNNAASVLRTLKEFNVDLRIVTNPYFGSSNGSYGEGIINMIKEEKRRWIETHFPNIFSDIVFCKNKFELEDGDIIIDDYEWAVIDKTNPKNRFKGIWVEMFDSKFKQDPSRHADVVITTWCDLLAFQNSWIWSYRKTKTEEESKNSFYPEERVLHLRRNNIQDKINESYCSASLRKELGATIFKEMQHDANHWRSHFKSITFEKFELTLKGESSPRKIICGFDQIPENQIDPITECFVKPIQFYYPLPGRNQIGFEGKDIIIFSSLWSDIKYNKNAESKHRFKVISMIKGEDYLKDNPILPSDWYGLSFAHVENNPHFIFIRNISK